MKQILLTLKTLILLAACLSLNAQENNGQQSFQIVKNTILKDVSVISMIKPSTIVHPENGSASFSYSASGVYDLTYVPDSSFVGEDYFVAEYYENIGIPAPKYIHFYIDVKNSIITTNTDYVNSNVNTTIGVYPLENDYASHGPLSIVAASFVTGGSVSLSQDGQEMTFIPELDFIGTAYINYVVKDSLDNSATGVIKIAIHDVQDINNYELIKLATTNKNPATILLPLPGFQLDSTNLPLHGSVDFVGTDVIEYTSNFGNASIDTFSVIKGSQYEREVIIETIHIPEPNGFVIDDYVITTVGEPVTFDVQENDIKKNFPIVSFTEDTNLVQDTLDASVFTYYPVSGFQGKKVFSYTVTNGIYNETAYITILVSNFDPQNNAVYNLTTPKNTPLVINYDIPISNFSFIENLTPVNGNLDIYSGIDTIAVGCDEISGYNLVTYTPDNDFTGTDQFEILYCVDNNACELVKVFVEIKDIGLDSICLCVTDCVWAGDADHDGKVSVADLLPIAYHQGLSGDVREEAGTSSTWFGQHAADWDVKQVYNNEDVKHVDSNGDGFIAGDDLIEIENYYNRFHDLVAPDNLVIKDYPFTLHTDQDTIYAGDYLHLEVHIGSDEYPALNLHGLAYGLSFPPTLIDSSSVSVDFLNDMWFGANSPSMEMSVQPYGGRIEASFSRTSGIPVSGHGIVAKADFIIEDDIIGLKYDEEVIPVEINLDAIKVQGIGGEQFTLPSFKKVLYLDLRDKKTSFNPDVDLNMYPNPTTDQVFVHSNKGVDIIKVQVFNSTGQMLTEKNIGFTTARLDVQDYFPGIYFIKVHTEYGINIMKLIKE